MLTDDGTAHDPSALNELANLDTLSAEDAGAPKADANLDDRLLHRDLKSRIFGSSVTVRIGRYEILRRIGRGGMGTVYVAHDPELDRKVALKVLRADRRSGRERMLQEARALARLAHPNVVTVHEVGVHDDRVFVAMEFIEGWTLRTWLAREPSRAELFSVFAQAARGLVAAHRAGLVHRDFKPENVLIGDDDRVRVVDFGVVKATDSLDATDRAESLDSASVMPDLTLTGQMLGTPAYMAAEQFLGEAVDGRTDVFAFCVSLYEALTGRRPFDGNDVGEISKKVLDGTVPPLDVPDVPKPLRDLILAGLSRRVDDRPRSMEGLLRALEATNAPVLAPKRSMTRTMLSFGGATAGALLLGMAGMTFVDLQPAETDVNIEVQTEDPAPESPPPVDEATQAEQAAFMAIMDADDEEGRVAAAQAYIDKEHTKTGLRARKAIAHSIVGNALWSASCPDSFYGLCVTALDGTTAGPRCDLARSRTLVPQKRDTKLAGQARDHLKIAKRLAGVEPPTDKDELKLFKDSIGRAVVQLADQKLEGFFELRVPTDLDFVDNKDLSEEAFSLYFSQMTRQGAELVVQYADVKKAGAPRWVLAAAARTGLLSENAADGLGGSAIPSTADDENAKLYCTSLEPYVAPMRKTARDAYTYCVAKADRFGVSTPEVDLCRSRLENLSEAE